jgi:hypothetical protein
MFFDLPERPRRLRVNGTASVSRYDAFRRNRGPANHLRVHARSSRIARATPEGNSRAVFMCQARALSGPPGGKGFDLFKGLCT